MTSKISAEESARRAVNATFLSMSQEEQVEFVQSAYAWLQSEFTLPEHDAVEMHVEVPTDNEIVLALVILLGKHPVARVQIARFVRDGDNVQDVTNDTEPQLVLLAPTLKHRRKTIRRIHLQ